MQRIKKYIKSDEILKNIIEKSNKAIEKLYSIAKIETAMSWYDINSNNILVDEQSEITGFLDPGGARFAAKEWDIAFIKMDLCNNEDEYNYFKKAYCKCSSFDEELLEILTIIVEIDDIAFQLESNIKLPIAFDSNFKNELEHIQNEYIK